MDLRFASDLSPAYRAACEAHDAALAVFIRAQAAYREQRTGDAEYLAARALFDAATLAYDAAFDAESRRTLA